MYSLLQQLENNEAVLLMYLADELPGDDRAEVAQLLASDSALRSELEALRSTQDYLTQVFSAADGLAIPAVVEDIGRQAAAARQVSRAMVRYRLESEQRAAREQARPAVRALRLPKWSYPFAAAAMVLIAWVSYWGFTGGGAGRSHEDPNKGEIAEATDHPGYLLGAGGGPLAEMLLKETDTDGVLPPLAVQKGDRDLMAVSAGAYDVSSMFQPDPGQE